MTVNESDPADQESQGVGDMYDKIHALSFEQATYFYGWYESELNNRVKEAKGSKARVEAENYRRAALRKLVERDLYYLLAYVCMRKDIRRPWLYKQCRMVEAEPNDCLDLWAREHYKSTIITFGKTLQDILTDPLLTVGIFSHTREVASVFVRQLKKELEGNKLLYELFPDRIWENPGKGRSDTWTDNEFTLKRPEGNYKEATVEGWGLITGQPTSKHFGLRVYDDVVTDKSVTNPTQVRRTIDGFNLSDNLGKEGGHVRAVGTRYAIFDPYRDMEERGVFKVRKFPATSDGTDDVTQAVLMSPTTLAKKRRTQGIYTFSTQMLINPLADKSQGFHEEWLQYWECEIFTNLNLALLVDPASGKHREKEENDYTCMWVIGLGSDGVYRVCDVVRDRLNPTERINTFFALHRKWRPLVSAYEDTGLCADMHYIEQKIKAENYTIKNLINCDTSMSKLNRIRRLIPLFQNGEMLLPTSLIRKDWEGNAVDLIKIFREDEYLTFPLVAHDDMLDAMARILDEDVKDLLVPPMPSEKQKERQAIAAARRLRRQQAGPMAN